MTYIELMIFKLCAFTLLAFIYGIYTGYVNEKADRLDKQGEEPW